MSLQKQRDVWYRPRLPTAVMAPSRFFHMILFMENAGKETFI